MDFLDKIGRKASEAYKMTTDKTGKIAKETKLKLKINELKTQINDIYEEIGKKVYEKHIREEEFSIKKDLEEQCTKIDVLSDEIDSLLKQCLELKDKKQCPNCFSEIEKEMKFCPNCGQKQTNEPTREAQILEDLENSEIEEDNEQETEIIKNYLQEDIENSNQKEQESDNEQEENGEENNNEEEKSNLEKTVAIESDVDIEENKKEQEE